MIKRIFTLTLVFISSIITAQSQTIENRQIRGEVVGKSLIPDTILFTCGYVNKKYYSQRLNYALLKSNHYVVQNNLTYPVMFKIAFASEKDIRV